VTSPNKGTTQIIILVAVLAGWFWRVGYKEFPGWEPVLFLAGMITVLALTEWLWWVLGRAERNTTK
jgi:hypothetical protein